MLKKLYHIRFELFFFTQLAILFGSIIMPYELFDNVLLPILFLVNLIAGIVLISKSKRKLWFFVSLFCITIILLCVQLFLKTNTDVNLFVGFTVYFLFYAFVTVEIIKQIWTTENVNKNVIYGLMSGYISLGLVAFFLFVSIELAEPESIKGLLATQEGITGKSNSLLYFSYITLLTIGYGDMVPISYIAQKATILVGFAGQFYMVIVTAIVIEKYIRHSAKN